MRVPSAPPFTSRMGMDVTRVPTGNWSVHPGPWPIDLADEFVTEHDVAIGVVQRPPGGIVDAEFRVVHEVDIGRADRGGQRPQQQFTLAGHRIGDLPDRQISVLQDHRPHTHLLCYCLDYSRCSLELLN